MASANSVSFKVYLIKSGANSNSEVRRFGIDRDVVSSFSYLREKLQQIFPSLQGQGFLIHWEDADNDTVAISCDEELIIALTEIPADVKKLYVTIVNGDSGTGPKQVHFNIVCDNCNGSVIGFRYKCIECTNFDLCQQCEANGAHSEHSMLRISQPRTFFPKFPFRINRLLSRGSRADPHCPFMGNQEESGCPFAKKRSFGKYDHCKKFKKGEDESMESSDDCKEKKHRHYKHKHHHQRKHGSDEDCEAEMNLWEQLLSGGIPRAETADANNEEAAHIKILRTVGNTVANILDPLGIAVDFDIKTKDKQENNKSAEAGTNTAQDKNMNTTRSDEVLEIPIEINLNQTPSSNIDQLTEFLHQQKLSDAVEREDWTILNNETSKQTAPPTTPLFPTPSNIAATAPSASTAPLYPNLQPALQQQQQQYPIPPQMRHPNPIIADSLDKMLSMGFTNDGGWLTQLLESKNGDIYKTLDVLQPVRK